MESDLGRAFDLGLRLLVNPLDRLHRGQLLDLLSIAEGRGDHSLEGLEQLRLLLSASKALGARTTIR